MQVERAAAQMQGCSAGAQGSLQAAVVPDVVAVTVVVATAVVAVTVVSAAAPLAAANSTTMVGTLAQ